MNRVCFFIFAFLIQVKVFALEECKPCLSLEEAWNLVLDNHEKVKSFRIESYQAGLNISQTLHKLLPCIGVSGAVTFSNPSKAVDGSRIVPAILNTVSVTVTQSLLDLRIKPCYLSAKRAKEATCHQNEFELYEILYLTSGAYLTLLQAKDLLQVSENQLALAEQHYLMTKERYEQGEVPVSDLLRSEEEVYRSKCALQAVLCDILIYEEQLSNLVGVDICGYQLAYPVCIDVGNKPNLCYLIDEAYKRRQDLKSVEASIESIEQQVRALKRTNWPKLDIQGDYTLASPETLIYRNNSVSAALWLRIPICDGGLNCLAVKNAEAELSKQQLLFSRMQKDLIVQVKTAYYALDAAEANFSLLEKSLAIAKENYSILTERYKKGQTTNIDLLQALNAYIQAEANFAIARYNLILLTIQLKKETGFFENLFSSKGVCIS
jgi:outer membrane protein TolC